MIVPTERCEFHLGECRAVLKSMAAESVHACITSPPYYSLRCYGLPDVEWEDGERCPLGLESTPEGYIRHIVEVFREVRRVLRPDATLWCNLGDSYAAGRLGRDDGGRPEKDRGWATYDYGSNQSRPVPPGYKAKDLMGLPWEVALALRRDGWWLRSCCIWDKLNPMPESVRDRPTTSHEYVFLLARSATYYYDADAVRQPHTEPTQNRYTTVRQSEAKAHGGRGIGSINLSGADYASNTAHDPFSAGRNLRTVWSLATEPYAEAHFATYPTRLVEPCVKAGTSEHGVCGGCGSPYRRVVEATGGVIGGSWHNHEGDEIRGNRGGSNLARGHATYRREHKGWQPTCTCGRDDVEPAVVLDPFGGSGTTGAVAVKLGRRAILIDQKAQYLALAQERIAKEPTRLFAVPGEVRPKPKPAPKPKKEPDPPFYVCPETLPLPLPEVP